MRDGKKISAIIPALNEENSIGKVLDDIPDWVDETIVADNGSSDQTSEAARDHGARVVFESRRGYGSACLKAMSVMDEPDIVVYLDGDYSDYPEQMDRLVDPIISGEADIVIGSRVLGKREPGALTPQARFGNRLSCLLIDLFWGIRFTDLGPFRAVSADALRTLSMSDPDYGWTVEMQVKAAQRKMKILERPVDYRRRIGTSKVSGTLRGVIGAGTKILGTIFLALIKDRILVLRSKPDRNRLILFTRYPEPGRCKTRLIPVLGEQGAADVQKEMTERELDICRKFAGRSNTKIEIRFDGIDKDAMSSWLGADLDYANQGEGDIGIRMLRAFDSALAQGAQKVVIIGSDIPGINEEILNAAFKALNFSDLILGPAADGGYYLIGAKRSLPALFRDMPWGESSLLHATLEKTKALNLSVTLLPTLQDVDRPEDLPAWEGFK